MSRRATLANAKAGAVSVGCLHPGFRKQYPSRELPPRSWWKLPCRALHVVAIAFVIGGGGIARADVLYDSTVFITDEGNWHNSFILTTIGGQALFGDFRDTQGADDFFMDGTYEITSVTGDYQSLGGGPPPADGVLVEFFSQTNDCTFDGGPCPEESPVAAVLSIAVTVTTILPDIFEDAFRLTVDLSGEGITLGPGTWWISITPVDLTPETGLAAGQFTSILGEFGANAYFRNGGEDHGNGYPGLFDAFDWKRPSTERDLAMKIEGTPVKPGCPWDLDDNAAVGVSDFLSLLASWGPCPPKGDCPADFDGNGDVGVSDFLELLGNWGPCP